MKLEKNISEIFEKPELLKIQKNQKIVLSVMEELDKSKLRVVEKNNQIWQVNTFVKQAILLYFRIKKVTASRAGIFEYADKIPLKKRTRLKDVHVGWHQNSAWLNSGPHSHNSTWNNANIFESSPLTCLPKST
jgi:2,3,4,5-tetrahydropyridine-2-carboxylate N-succinyltransferase